MRVESNAGLTGSALELDAGDAFVFSGEEYGGVYVVTDERLVRDGEDCVSCVRLEDGALVLFYGDEMVAHLERARVELYD